MQSNGNRVIAIGTLGAVLATTFGGPGLPAARAGSNAWRNLAIGAGVVTGYGLLKHKRTLSIAGGVATGLAYLKYRKERKKEQQARTAYYRPVYPSYGRTYAPVRHYSALPYRYSRPAQPYRAYHYAPRRHSYYHPATYRHYQRPSTHVWRSHSVWHRPAPYVARVATVRHAPRPAAKHLAAAALIAAPALVAAHSAMAHKPVVAHPVAATVPVAPAAALTAPATAMPTANAAPGGFSGESFLFGFLAAVLGVGMGFALSHLARRRTPATPEYPHFDPPQRRSVS